MASHNTHSVDNFTTKWNKNTEYAFGLQRKIISFLGYWPKNEFNKSSKIKIGILNITQMFIVIFFIKNLIVSGNCGSGEELVDALTFILVSLLAILKNSLPWFQKIFYTDILNFLIDDWFYFYNISNKSHDIMLKYAKIGRIVLLIQVLGTYGAMIPVIMRYPSTIQVLNEYNNDTILARNFPLGPPCWISMTMSWNLYIGFYVIFYIDLCILVTSFVASDVFLFTIAMHICGQFQILYNSMDNINNYKNYQQQRFIVKNFVIRHNQLLIMLKNFEKICNKIIFCEVMGNTFLICISGFIVLQSFDFSQNKLEFGLVVRMFILFLQLFLYSYAGENLTNRAKNLQSVIYNSSWDDLSPKIIKDMTFIILHTQYEFYLTAGKMQNMNLSNFKNIVKSIFSYLSVLRLMFQK
uniref:Odorant receptor n=1 Tax=Aphidius gifuensis TaxID=684658 RepID=A0A3Q9ELL3_APHGI|nr:odorant receptor [Aphidius gifuensis]